MTLQKVLKKSFHDNCQQVAIITDTFHEKYCVLEEKALYVSSNLINYCGINEMVAMLFGMPENYVYGVLGVLFSINILIPLDPIYPVSQLIRRILMTNCRYIIIDKSVSPKMITQLNVHGLKLLYIEDILKERSHFNPPLYGKSEDAIYVYFTSGTSGESKAVLGKNKSLLHFINWEIKEFNINNQDIFAQLTSPAFDPFLRDIFTPLCSGAKIRFTNRRIVTVPRLLGVFLRKAEITVLHTTPSILRALLTCHFCKDPFVRLRYLMLAGEPVTLDLIKKWNADHNRKTTLVNLYGPTETTLAKVFAYIPNNYSYENVPVGKPIEGVSVYVVNEMASLCEDGEIGEVYIETEYMTEGYLHDPNNPSFGINKQGNRWYKTGDLSFLRDGSLYLVGRIDDRIKIGGVRVRLNEIKRNVLLFPEEKIDDCVILYEKGFLFLSCHSTRKYKSATFVSAALSSSNSNSS